MRALTYHGSHDVRVESHPDPVLLAPDDLIVEVTATAICGSDLHLYHGRIPALKPGDILGHEFMGVVAEKGPGVTRLAVGDRVVVPFVIACGSCFFCRRQLYSACETTNPGPGGMLEPKGIRPSAALFGYSHLYGGIPGGQAQFVRVPRGNTGPIRIPSGLGDEQVLFLSDILPTGYQAVLDAGVGPETSVAIYGAGPVGLMAAACARMLGADPVFVADHQAQRLDFARRAYGVETLDAGRCDPAEAIVARTHRRGADAVIDAVGLEAKGSALEAVLTGLKLEQSSGSVLRQCIAAVRRGGTVSVPGVYTGLIHGFAFGDAFDKGIRFAMGQTHVQRHLPELLQAIQEGRLRPDEIITHRLPLEQAAEGYQLFDTQPGECRKVVLTP